MSPALVIRHIRDLEIGDEMKLGKRLWRYAGNSEDIPALKHEQAETVWLNISPEPGAVDRQRIMAWSEIEALIRAGIPFKRTVAIAYSPDANNMGTCKPSDLKQPVH